MRLTLAPSPAKPAKIQCCKAPHYFAIWTMNTTVKTATSGRDHISTDVELE